MSSKRQKPQWDHFPVIVTGWEASYHFGLIAGKYDNNTIGPYSESHSIVIRGKVFGAQEALNIADGLPVEIHTFFSQEKALKDREGVLGIGTIELDRGTLRIVQNNPLASATYILGLLSSNRVKAATITASKLVRHRGLVRGLGLHTKFEPEDWI